MKKLNLFLLVLFICNCPVVSGYAFFDRDIRLLTMQILLHLSTKIGMALCGLVLIMA